MTDRPTMTLRHPEPEVRAAQDCAAPVLKRFNGDWVIYRRVPRGYARPSRPLPRFHHKTFDAAAIEAGRLARQHPESTFVILQEQAVVKIRKEANAEV